MTPEGCEVVPQSRASGLLKHQPLHLFDNLAGRYSLAFAELEVLGSKNAKTDDCKSATTGPEIIGPGVGQMK